MGICLERTTRSKDHKALIGSSLCAAERRFRFAYANPASGNRRMILPRRSSDAGTGFAKGGFVDAEWLNERIGKTIECDPSIPPEFELPLQTVV